MELRIGAALTESDLTRWWLFGSCGSGRAKICGTRLMAETGYGSDAMAEIDSLGPNSVRCRRVWIVGSVGAEEALTRSGSLRQVGSSGSAGAWFLLQPESPWQIWINGFICTRICSDPIHSILSNAIRSAFAGVR